MKCSRCGNEADITRSFKNIPDQIFCTPCTVSALELTRPIIRDNVVYQMGYPDVKTLRDEFAMAALSGYLAQPMGDPQTRTVEAAQSFWKEFRKGAAAHSYALADAMLAERKKKAQ